MIRGGKRETVSLDRLHDYHRSLERSSADLIAISDTGLWTAKVIFLVADIILHYKSFVVDLNEAPAAVDDPEILGGQVHILYHGMRKQIENVTQSLRTSRLYESDATRLEEQIRNLEAALHSEVRGL
jgi:hypothetical protein